MPAEKSRKINLLPREEFASSTLGRIFTWALSSFRIIVIFVEGVVMVAFLSRFWLDAKASDLNETMKQKKAIIQAELPFEKRFKSVQTKLKVAKDLTATQGAASELLKAVSESLPADVHLTNFSFNDTSAQVKGLSASERSIVQFMVNLENSDLVQDVTLISADTDSDNKAFLVFSLKIAPGKGKGGKT